MKKNESDEPKRTTVKVEGTDAQKGQAEFDQQTNDIKLTNEWNTAKSK